MTTLNLTDLNISQALDRKALTELRGRGQDHFRSQVISYGAWSGYTLSYSAYIGTTFHDGYLSRHYLQGWQRSRTQTETNYWDRFFRV